MILGISESHFLSHIKVFTRCYVVETMSFSLQKSNKKKTKFKTWPFLFVRDFMKDTFLKFQFLFRSFIHECTFKKTFTYFPNKCSYCKINHISMTCNNLFCFFIFLINKNVKALNISAILFVEPVNRFPKVKKEFLHPISRLIFGY